MTAGELERLEAAARALEAAGHGERSKAAKAQAERLGISVPTLYRKLEAAGLYRSGRKRRADAGAIRKEGVSDEQIKLIAAMMLTSKRNTGHVEMSAEDAIARAEANGIVAPGLLTPDTLRRHLRRLKLDARAQLAPTPHQDMASLHPNHVHQMDPSVCLQWYFEGAKGMAERDMVAVVYKNKPDELARAAGKKTKKILRYVLTDHFSGTIFVRYYHEYGEKQTTAIDFLIEAWSRKENGNPFHGVPRILVWDQGSANTARGTEAFLDSLGVNVMPHLPHNPRAKGQVENANYIVQRSFEAGLRISPATDLDWLNEQAAKWCAWFNATKIHSRHHMTRFGCWQMIRPEELREIRVDKATLQRLASHPVRTMKIKGNYTITLGRDAEGVPVTFRLFGLPGMAPGMKVQVRRNVFEPGKVEVRLHEDEPWIEVSREEMRPGGFLAGAAVIGEEHKQPAHTGAMKAGREIERLTYGTDTDREAENARKRGEKPLSHLGIDAHKHFNDFTPPAYMNRPGTELPIAAAPAEAAPIPITKALIRIAQRLGRPLATEENQKIRTEYANGMTEAEIEAWVNRRVTKDRLRAV